MKTPIQKTIRLRSNNNVDTKINIFNSTNKTNPKYYSLTALIGKPAVMEYEYTFVHNAKTYGRATGTLIPIPDTLTTEEEVRDYILSELSK